MTHSGVCSQGPLITIQGMKSKVQKENMSQRTVRGQSQESKPYWHFEWSEGRERMQRSAAAFLRLQ